MSEPKRILLVDDEESFLYSTADILRREGYECRCAPDARSAADLLRQGSFDLLISDIKMQGNSDLEFIKEVPEMADGMPVILVTGYPSLKSAIDSIELPVVAYLIKPFELSELLERVKQVVDGGRWTKTRKLEITLKKIANDLEEAGFWAHDSAREGNWKNVTNFPSLTPREWDILRLLRANQRVTSIAVSLHISPSTVRNHLKSIFQKLGVHSQMELLERLNTMSEGMAP